MMMMMMSAITNKLTDAHKVRQGKKKTEGILPEAHCPISFRFLFLWACSRAEEKCLDCPHFFVSNRLLHLKGWHFLRSTVSCEKLSRSSIQISKCLFIWTLVRITHGSLIVN